MIIDRPTETFENSNHDHSNSANGGVIALDANLPSQTGKNGNVLTSNGTTASWQPTAAATNYIGNMVFS